MLTTLGFVLSKKNVREYDREYCFFTKKYGKINLIAKSVRKPLSKLSAQLEPPALIEIAFIPNDDKGLITTALAKKSYFKIRKNLDKFKAYLQIANTVNALTDLKQKDEAL
jgi:DNA repair protein RecO